LQQIGTNHSAKGGETLSSVVGNSVKDLLIWGQIMRVPFSGFIISFTPVEVGNLSV